MVIKESFGDRVFNAINFVILTLILLVVLYPLIYIVSASFSNPDAVTSGKMWLIPIGFTLDGYKQVFSNSAILTGFGNTLFYVGVGTLLNLACTMPAAYALSKKRLAGRNFFMFLITFTMFFSGGLIPSYMLMKGLGLVNTRWVMIFTGLVGAYNLIISRTYFASTMPQELEEAAYIDGCSTTRSFLSIALPLAKPIIAVIALYYAISRWNGYFTAMVYITDKSKYPLSLVLQQLLRQSVKTEQLVNLGIIDAADYIKAQKMVTLLRYAMIVVSTTPLIILYLFVQKYFVKGIMIGSIKG
ncbi:MAG: carbohydrate ABC transporter permease [Defluviitaleaceae bacterium]|nr:carbohydrate ABC transporter permease [Defluviitaleaceae bacterium]